MPKKNRENIDFPPEFMKEMKKQKRKKMRNIPIDKSITDQRYNNASWVL